MIQFFIAATGALQIWLLSEKGGTQKWGFVVMIFSNIFWTIETINKELWGMFMLNLFYWFCSFKGIYLYWIKENYDTQ